MPSKQFLALILSVAFVLVLTLLLLAGCTPAPATTPALTATLTPTAVPDEAETRPTPGCLELDYEWVSMAEAIQRASTIVIGTVNDVSPPRWNQDSGEYWEGAASLPYYEATVLVEQSIRGDGEPGEKVIATILGNCPDEGFIQAGERVLLLLEERAIAWRTGSKHRIMLYPLGKYLLTQDGQALNAADSSRNTTLEQLLTRISQIQPLPTQAAVYTPTSAALQPTETPAPPRSEPPTPYPISTPAVESPVNMPDSTIAWIALSAGHQRIPRIAGDTVVWAQDDPSTAPSTTNRLGVKPPSSSEAYPEPTLPPSVPVDTRVWVKSLSSGKAFAVSNAPGTQEYPDISGDVIVWADTRNTCPTCAMDIYGYRLSTGQEFPIATGPTDQILPAISGSVVVWQEAGAIRGRDLSSGQEFDIAPPLVDGYYQGPAIDGDIVVYADTIPDPMDRRIRASTLYAYNLRTEVRSVVADDILPPWLTYAISGNRVAWTNSAVVHVFDLATGQDTVLPSQWSPSGVAIDEDLAVWFELPPTSDRFRLAGYDLVHDAYFVIYESPKGDQTEPSLSGTTVVWMSERNGIFNIAMSHLNVRAQEDDSNDQLAK